MELEAVKQADQRLRRARLAVESLERLLDFADISDAWGQFLLASAGIYSKLETGAKHNRSNGWFGRKKRERKTDELLCYLHHARNADEHGIAPLTKFAGFTVELKDAGRALIRAPLDENFQPGQERVRAFREDGTPGRVEVRHIARLVPVTDREVIYHPPRHYRGTTISEDDIVLVARIGLAHLETLVREAKLRA